MFRTNRELRSWQLATGRTSMFLSLETPSPEAQYHHQTPSVMFYNRRPCNKLPHQSVLAGSPILAMRYTLVSHVHRRRAQSEDFGKCIFKFNSVDTIFQLDVHCLVDVYASYSYDVNCFRVISLTFTLCGSGRNFHRAYLSQFNSGRLQNLIFIRASP